MRVLLRNEQQLSCMEVVTATFNPDDDELILENTENYVTVSGITAANSRSILYALFQNGTADLSMYRSDI